MVTKKWNQRHPAGGGRWLSVLRGRSLFSNPGVINKGCTAQLPSASPPRNMSIIYQPNSQNVFCIRRSAILHIFNYKNYDNTGTEMYSYQENTSTDVAVYTIQLAEMPHHNTL